MFQGKYFATCSFHNKQPIGTREGATRGSCVLVWGLVHAAFRCLQVKSSASDTRPGRMAGNRWVGKLENSINLLSIRRQAAPCSTVSTPACTRGAIALLFALYGRVVPALSCTAGVPKELRRRMQEQHTKKLLCTHTQNPFLTTTRRNIYITFTTKRLGYVQIIHFLPRNNRAKLTR
jgi:hypothetical protein